MPAVPVIVKIGTSSLTDEAGHIRLAAIDKLCDEIASLRSAGRQVVVVTSAAITAGLPALGFAGARPQGPSDAPGGLGGGPEPADGALRGVARPPRAGQRSGPVVAVRLLRAQPVPACPRHPRAPPRARAWCRWSTKTTPSPTTPSASATTTGSRPSSPIWSVPSGWCCSPTPPVSTPPTPAPMPMQRSWPRWRRSRRSTAST